MTPTIRNTVALGLFLLCAFLAGATGYFFPPGDWYASLNKPVFSPPSWVFGPVWTTLYVLMSVAAWQVWRKTGWSSVAIRLWCIQIALNALWTPLFFGAHALGLALIEMGVLWAFILWTTIAFHRVSKPAVWMMVPYLAWVSFAWFLNAALFRLNN